MHPLAQSFSIGNLGPSGSIPGKPVTISGPLVGINNITDLVGKITTFLIPLAGIILFGIIVWGGYDVLMSGGSPDKVSAGKQKITAGIVGFVLLVSSYFMAKLLGYIFGVGDGIL